jgi:hypothetical protein
MFRQSFLTIGALLKHSRVTLSWPVLSVLALLLLAPAVTVGAAEPLSPWSTQLNGQGRFHVLPAFNKDAVLDKETGLVWEQSPDTTARNFISARSHCINGNIGGRKGWRLPSIEELASLIDPNAASAPFLPAGHPFTNVQSAVYWSATSLAGDATVAWFVHFSFGLVDPTFKAEANHVWCVRGDGPLTEY